MAVLGPKARAALAATHAKDPTALSLQYGVAVAFLALFKAESFRRKGQVLSADMRAALMASRLSDRSLTKWMAYHENHAVKVATFLAEKGAACSPRPVKTKLSPLARMKLSALCLAHGLHQATVGDEGERIFFRGHQVVPPKELPSRIRSLVMNAH